MTDRWIRSSLVEIMPPLQPELNSQAVVFPPFGALRIASNPEGGGEESVTLSFRKSSYVVNID